MWVNSKLGGSGVLVCEKGEGKVGEVREGVRRWVKGGEEPEVGDVEAWKEFVEELTGVGDMRVVRIVRALLEVAGELEGWRGVCEMSVRVVGERWKGVVI